MKIESNQVNMICHWDEHECLTGKTITGVIYREIQPVNHTLKMQND